jgi:Acetyltransferases, including N-acetylases of ribosomal proteins
MTMKLKLKYSFNIIFEQEIMIAEPESRKKGIATEAIKIMIVFGYEYYKKTKFIAKIKQNNTPSIKFFEKLGFKFVRLNLDSY